MDSFRKWRQEQRKLAEFNRPTKELPNPSKTTRILEDKRTGEVVVQRRLGPNAWQDVPLKQR